jgi:prepilin-type N-terminal cleavage/methylation domain-containing protein
MKPFFNRQGLTFIECIVALVILGVGIVGVVGCLTAALISNQKASDLQLATAIAQNTIEDMRSYGFGSVTYDDFPETSEVPELHGGQRAIVITDNHNGEERLKKVEVTVSWRSRNNQQTARVYLETVIGNRATHTGS